MTPTDLNARAEMQLGAAYAGLAIESSMLGAAHSAANPLTAHHGVIHGQAVGIMLPQVVRFNAEDSAARAAYAELGATAGLRDAEQLAERIEELLGLAGLSARLREFGVSDLPLLAEEAAKQWTASFNPRTISSADFVHLYENVL